jgi:hypothetical protein
MALYTGMEQLLPQPQMSTASTAARYRPMPQEPVTTASTSTLTIPAQEAAVGDAIDLGADADLPVPLVPIELDAP